MTQSWVTTAAFGGREEVSTGGSLMMVGDVVEEWRRWDSAGEVVVVTTRMVTVELWWVVRRLASSRTGIRWPMPGLERMAKWGGGDSMRRRRERERVGQRDENVCALIYC